MFCKLPKELQNLTFLIVDDMSFYLSLLQQTLTNIGHTGKVYSAKDVKSAVVKINEIFKSGEKIDFIISDLNLSDSTGIVLVTKIRQNKTLKDIPFLLYTTDDNSHKIISAVEAGIDDYFFKPIDDQILHDKIIVSCSKHMRLQGQ